MEFSAIHGLFYMEKSAYSEYYASKDEYLEALTYQTNLAGLFRIDDRDESQKEKQKEK